MELTIKQFSSLEKLRPGDKADYDEIHKKSAMAGERISYQIGIAIKTKESMSAYITVDSELSDHIRLYRVKDAYMEELLTRTHQMAVSPAKTVSCGSGWGKLENVRREKQGEPMVCPYLDFGQLQPEQLDWLKLLESGCLPQQEKNRFPQSWMLQKEWTQLLKNAPDSHEKYLHLAAIYVATERTQEAKEAALQAVGFSSSVGALFVLAQAERLLGNVQGWADALLQAQKLCPNDIPLVRETFAAALAADRLEQLVDIYEQLPKQIAKDGRTGMLCACALVRLGQIDRAEELLYRDGGLVVEDIRECEESLPQLYLDIEKAKAERSGLPFDEETVTVPRQFDFRMFVK